MKRKIKRLFRANKTKVGIFLLFLVLYIVSFGAFVYYLVILKGIETLLRIIIIFLFLVYLLFYIKKGYRYVVKRSKFRYSLLMLMTLVFIVIFTAASIFINILYGSLGNMSNDSSTNFTGYLISMSSTTDIKDAGIITDEEDIEGYIIAKEIIEDNKLDYELKEYDNYDDMIYDLYNGTITSAFMMSDYIDYYNVYEEYANISTDTKVLYKKDKVVKDKKDYTSNKSLDEPFTMLLMGVDSEQDTINTASSFNGDTLMLITFNPKTLNVSVFSIPRDLYVPISCRKGNSAKINSSSVGGVPCVIETIKNLTDIDIDYYAKINFKGVVGLVDALDGIDVEVTFPFCEQDSNRSFENMICLEKGYQHLNGEQTLAYARHRHSLPTGDLQRIQNQQLIVEALSKKAFELNTITEFKDILDAISRNINTNMSRTEMLSAYSILKNMLKNIMVDEDALVINKAYLEVYDKNIYNQKSGRISMALGYYDSSLKDIVKMMKVNLELEDPEIIKTFSFDANSPYELKIAGKGKKNEVSNTKVPSFIGLTVSEVESWCSTNNISLEKEFVQDGDAKYNSSVEAGLVANQSIPANSSIDNITSFKIYINTAS